MTIREIVQKTYSEYKLPPLDRELLLSYALKKPREYIFTHPEYRLAKNQVARFKSYVSRRLRGEPIAYITGKKEFYGLEFKVDRNVLIPRPETELLVEAALRGIRNYELGITNIVDVGTGSGNIIISAIKNILPKKRRHTKSYALDKSKKALDIAKKNAQKHKVSEDIEFIQSDLLKYFLKNEKLSAGNFLIVANLPYVSQKIYKKHEKGLKYEPKNALISKDRGLAHYIRLIKQIKALSVMRYALPVHNATHSVAGGCMSCFLEISPEQATSIKKAIQKYFPKARIKFHKDLSKRNRVVEFNISPKDIFIAS